MAIDSRMYYKWVPIIPKDVASRGNGPGRYTMFKILSVPQQRNGARIIKIILPLKKIKIKIKIKIS